MTHFPERRLGGDRRRKPTPALSRYSIGRGRRIGHRRLNESARSYVDQLGSRVWLAILAIFLLQVLDAYLTLAHLRRGGLELNPLMDALIARSDHLFVGVKLGVAGIGLLFLGMHRNFPMVRSGLTLLAVLFLGVVGWHCFLVLQSV